MSERVRSAGGWCLGTCRHGTPEACARGVRLRAGVAVQRILGVARYAPTTDKTAGEMPAGMRATRGCATESGSQCSGHWA